MCRPRPRPAWPRYEHLDTEDARFSAAQTRYGLGGILHGLDEATWVNHPLREAAADYKPRQLALAQRLGFTVPATLVTNSLPDAREFIATHGPVIYKTLCWTPYERDGIGLTTWAEPVTADELDPSVAVTPHLFQTRVDKTADLRVLVVGPHLFAIRIDSQLPDWRKDYSALTYTVNRRSNRGENTSHESGGRQTAPPETASPAVVNRLPTRRPRLSVGHSMSATRSVAQ